MWFEPERQDGLGRTIGVTETGLNSNTSYSYDPLDNLTLVQQSGQTRQFKSVSEFQKPHSRGFRPQLCSYHERNRSRPLYPCQSARALRSPRTFGPASAPVRSHDELGLTAVFSSVFMECAHRTLFKSKLKIDLPVEFRRRIFVSICDRVGNGMCQFSDLDQMAPCLFN